MCNYLEMILVVDHLIEPLGVNPAALRLYHRVATADAWKHLTVGRVESRMEGLCKHLLLA